VKARRFSETQHKIYKNTIMKKLMKSILIILLLLLGLGVSTLLAAQTETATKDTLVVKQFSIDSPGGEFREDLGPQEGILTFRILAGVTTGVNADQILQWIEDGTMRLSGVRFSTDHALTVNAHKLSVPFELERPLQGEYLETELIISGSDWIEDAETDVSLYGGSHGVVDLSLIGEGKRMSGKLISRHTPSVVNFSHNPVAFTSRYRPVAFVRKENPADDKRNGGFLYRNRAWVIGAATLVASSATALIMSGGDSVTYLPEPPGRP
jgi:hypothetical protein